MTAVWPTREEWAVSRRTFFADYADDVHVSGSAHTWGTSKEVSDAVVAFDTARRELLPALREAKATAGDLLRRPNEPQADYIARRLDFTEAEEAAFQAVTQIQGWRRNFYGAFKALSRDWMPAHYLVAVGPVPAEYLTLATRRDEARAEAVEDLRRKIESRPVDDAAWVRELDRRRDIKASRGDPTRSTVATSAEGV